jgi:hypothetical protein
MITLSEIRRREIHIAALHRILLVQDAIVLAKWDRRQTRKPWHKPAGRMSAMRLLLIALALVVAETVLTRWIAAGRKAGEWKRADFNETMVAGPR